MVKNNQIGQKRIHSYTDENGRILAEKHITKMPDGSKKTRWYTVNLETGEKTIGLNGAIMPLYHADKLHTSKSETVWFAEGEKDVETLERCFNLLATCTSNGGRQATWYDDLYNADLEGRSIGIFTDNDEVGENYGDFIAKNVCKIAKSVKIIPIKAIWAECPEKGDISDAVEALGKDKVLELLSSAIKKIKDYEPETNEKQSNNRTNNKIADLPNWIQLNNRGMSVNPELLAEYIMNTENYIFVQLREQESQQCYWYQNGVYVRISAKHIKARIRAIIQKYYTEIAKIRVIEDTYKHITYPDEKHFVSDESLLDADENIINFQNGVLHLDTLELKEHSPEYLSTVQIPCDWNPKAKETVQTFYNYITHLADDDWDSALTLIQAIGFAISNVKIKRFKKSLILCGAGNSGKSLFLEFMSLLIGKDNFVAMPFEQLDKRFSMSTIYRKRIAGDDDCNYCNFSSVSTFKSITGGGKLICEEKGKQSFTFIFDGLYVICANSLPLFGGDKGTHVYERIIPIKCGSSIPENQRDKKLIEKLYAEREAIIYLAVMEFKKTIENNYTFTVSAKSKELLEEYKIENDIVLQFINECCEIRTTYDNVTTKVLYDAFKTWCFQNGERYIPKKSQFSEGICNFYGVEPTRTGRNKIQRIVDGKHYFLHTLTQEAKKELHIVSPISDYYNYN